MRYVYHGHGTVAICYSRSSAQTVEAIDAPMSGLFDVSGPLTHHQITVKRLPVMLATAPLLFLISSIAQEKEDI